ncbi:hypothetical protein GGI26_004625 [Coemansia sp. RSA 1358]|nr:hypothetical protein GGI26_004625 [Coemansia sp. RSA 1358]
MAAKLPTRKPTKLICKCGGVIQTAWTSCTSSKNSKKKTTSKKATTAATSIATLPVASASSTAAVKTDTPAAAGTITKDSAEYQASVDKFYARLTEAKTSKQILVAKIELIEELDFDLYNEGPFMADANKRLKEITALKAKNAD